MGDSGVVELDFGAFPGCSHVDLDVTATGVISTSEVEAWVQPKDTADHTADEHVVETLAVFGRYKSDGVITVTGVNTSQLNEPVYPWAAETHVQTAGASIAVKTAAAGVGRQGGGGRGTRLYGKFNVGWVWV